MTRREKVKWLMLYGLEFGTRALIELMLLIEDMKRDDNSRLRKQVAKQAGGGR